MFSKDNVMEKNNEIEIYFGLYSDGKEGGSDGKEGSKDGCDRGALPCLNEPGLDIEYKF